MKPAERYNGVWYQAFEPELTEAVLAVLVAVRDRGRSG